MGTCFIEMCENNYIIVVFILIALSSQESEENNRRAKTVPFSMDIKNVGFVNKSCQKHMRMRTARIKSDK